MVDADITIARVEVQPVAVPLKRHFKWPHGTQRGVNLTIICVETEPGVRGYGEALVDATPRSVAEVEAMTAELAGRSLGDIAKIRDSILRRAKSDTRSFARSIACAVEVACWDALGHALGVPSRFFFGGAVTDELDLYGFALGDDPESLASHARSLGGRRAIYMKVAGLPEYELCVAAVREAVGPDVLLRVDCNEAWGDASTAIEFIQRLRDYDIDWVEQPVARNDVAGLARVRRSVEVKIAADEPLESMQILNHVLESHAADVVVQDAHRAGGLLRLREQAALCEAAGVAVNLHAPMQSDISFYPHMQIGSTIPNITLGNQVMHEFLSHQLTEVYSPDSMESGRFRMSNASGHGFTIDLEAVKHANDRWHTDGCYAIDAS